MKRFSLNRLWRNWPVHNLIGHPLHEIVRWFFGAKAAEYVHDLTLPPPDAPAPVAQEDPEAAGYW